MGEVHRRERRPDPARGEDTRIADRHDDGAIGHEGQSDLANPAAHRGILLVNPPGLRKQRVGIAAGPKTDLLHATECVLQIYRGRPRPLEPGDSFSKHRPRIPASPPRDCKRDSIRRRDPDQRRAADSQRLDRPGHLLQGSEVHVAFFRWEQGLIEDADGAGIPGEGRGNRHRCKMKRRWENCERHHPINHQSARPQMTYSTLLFEVRDGIAFVTINRPDKLNALNDAVIEDLDRAVARVESDDAIKGVLLTGAGPKAFVAGADIGELATQDSLSGKARAMRGQAVFRRLERCGKPVVAAVNGFALGGGCELAMACHLRVASETARFGQPEVKLGIGPGYGGTVRLPRLVGKGRALDLLLTARQVGAEEAVQMGLANRVVPAEQLMPEAEKLLRGILENGPLAVRLCLEAVDSGFEMGLEEALLLEANHFGLLASTSDMKEGMGAFLEKRKAAFQGR